MNSLAISGLPHEESIISNVLSLILVCLYERTRSVIVINMGVGIGIVKVFG